MNLDESLELSAGRKSDGMRSTWLRPTSEAFSARKNHVVLVVILLAVGLQSGLSAVSQPFWYDEVLTVVLCRLPSVSAIWAALQNAADTHPPGFFVLARLTHQLISADHLGYRLPSILGLLLAVCCVYLVLSRRLTRLTALAGAAFLLCTDLTPFSYEARPYALMVGFISLAIFAWQRIDDSRLYCGALAVSLAAATSLHYYAIFVWPAFAAAELTIWIVRRHFRITVWVALLVGAFPMLCFAGLLRQIAVAYGRNFWAQPHLKQMYTTYNNLLNVDSHWGVLFAIGVAAVVIWPRIVNMRGNGDPSGPSKETTVPLEEIILALVLMGLPVVAVVAVKISHGGLAERHMLPAILGCALTLGYAIDKIPTRGRLLLFVLFLVNYEAFSAPILRDAAKGSLFARRERAEHEIPTLAAQLHDPSLPIVIGSELDYLPISYYTEPELARRLHVVVDPESAVAYLNTASGDLNLLVIQRYDPLQVDRFDDFIANHREFYLVSGVDFNWITARLVHDGNTLKLVAAAEGGENPVYRVTIRSGNASEIPFAAGN